MGEQVAAGFIKNNTDFLPVISELHVYEGSSLMTDRKTVRDVP